MISFLSKQCQSQLFPSRSFGRYMNRGQKAAIDMKTDLTAYEFVPEMIS